MTNDSLAKKVGDHLRADGKTDSETRNAAVSLLEDRLNSKHRAADDGVVVQHALEDAGVHREVRIAVVGEIFDVQT